MTSLPVAQTILNGNSTLVLTGNLGIWYVESGALALFSTRPFEGSVPKGDRQYLFTVEAGELLWGLPSLDDTPPLAEPRIILAVALEATTLQPISPTDLTPKAIADPAFGRLVERWLQHWDGWLRDHLTPPPTTQATSNSRYVSLVNQQSLQAADGTVEWVTIQQGQMVWLDIDGLTLTADHDVFPITANTWLTTETPTQLQLRSLSLWDNDVSLLNGLTQFHRFFYRIISQLEHQRHEAEFQRFQERERLNQQILFSAMNDLAAPLMPERTPLPQDGSPLLVAAGAVAQAMGIVLRPPAASEDLSRVQDPLEAIARASKFRTRSVQLVGQWWQHEHGPLLAYTLEGQPIALLPGAVPEFDYHYISLDPVTFQRTRVDEAVAKTLSNKASMFYRPLPDTITKMPSILAFAARGHIRDIVLVVILGLLGSLLGMVVPQATKLLINDAIPGSDRGLVWQLGLALFAAACGRSAFNLAQGFLSMRIESAADATLQPAVWNRLLQLPTAFFRRYSMGDLLTRLLAVSQIRQELSGATQRTLLNAVFALLNLGLMFIYSVKLSFVALGITAVTILLTTISSVLLVRQARQEETLSGKLNGLNVELISGVAKLRVAAAEDRAFGAWTKLFSQRIQIVSRMQRIDDSVTVLTESLPLLSSVLILWFIMKFFNAEQESSKDVLSLGSFLAFNSAFGTFFGGITDLSNTITNILGIIPLWERAKPILQTPLESTADRADPGRLNGSLRMDHVVFRYREDGPLILDDVSLSAAPGEFIALVGPSGSGKSTLLRLLLGFETPITGTVYYDGQDLAGLDVHAVRRQCGVVLQNGRIGSGSLFDNITSGAMVSMSQAWDAAYMAGLANDIEQMPMGIHTFVSEGGSNLSGGQRQRLLIARAIVLKPKIILLDEATSALDNRTQAIVAQSLEHLKATRIVIAHRLSTIRNADRIYVMEAGRVVQSGRFEDLIHQEGLFAKLAARQLD